MRLNMTRLTLFLPLLFLFTGLAPIARAGTCSTATTAGEWGFTLTGTLLLPSGPAPAGAVGNATLRVDGNIYGAEARNVGGGFAKETFKGTYTVNANCAGTLTAYFYEGGQLVRISVLSLVFDDNSTQLRMVQQSLTLPDGTQVPVVITVEGRKH
jgi:hypothetical protein